MTAPAILPQQQYGGIAVTPDANGVPLPVAGAPANMALVATLPTTFTVGSAACPRTFHTNDCRFRVTGDQMNAIESEMLLLAAEFYPSGVWSCGIGNLAANFAAWRDGIGPGTLGAAIATYLATPAACSALQSCIQSVVDIAIGPSSDAGNIYSLGTDGNPYVPCVSFMCAAVAP